ncbi:MAG: 50S ribosomal protein L33 [Erysipelotrichaceae bacterium]|nr:50S ribosomal protein L33 [Erysipelotrichaceae bacterium]
MVKNDKVVLACTECLSRNYTTSRNKKSSQERLELMKFCKKCGKHTLHKETK